MTRETTIGLVVSCSFLCLVGVVIVTKMRPGTGPPPHADAPAGADGTVVPAAPTPAAPPGPPATPWGGVGTSSPAAALPGPSMAGAGGGSSGLESLGRKPPPLPLQPIRDEEKEKDLVLTRATSSDVDPKRGTGTLDRWGSSGRTTGERAASDTKVPPLPSTKEKELPVLPPPAAPVSAGT